MQLILIAIVKRGKPHKLTELKEQSLLALMSQMTCQLIQRI